MRSIILACFLFGLTTTTVRAEIINDFHCELNPGKTQQDLMAFHQEYFAATREAGFGAPYRADIWFPVYGADFATTTLRFTWRGHFSDWSHMGEINTWYLPSPWVARFAEMMSCDGSAVYVTPMR